jgi:hypothetical protein
MEWVFVSYPRVRDVYIDGRLSGRTNELLAAREGEQELDLGRPLDYRPRRRIAVVTGTTSSTPMRIAFAPKP